MGVEGGDIGVDGDETGVDDSVLFGDPTPSSILLP